MSSAELTLWARVEDLPRDAVQDALWTRRSLVKTWAMRGALHLLRADELPMYVAALGRLRPRHHVPSWLRHRGLTREGATAMLAAIPAALDGHPLTRDQLATAVAGATGHAELAGKLGGGFGDLLKPAAFAGDHRFAPSDRQRVRFTRPDRWLAAWEPADPEAGGGGARAALPGGVRARAGERFQRWFGMTSPAEAGRWLRGLGDQVTDVDDEGSRGWMLAADAAAAAEGAEPPGVVRLLPAFDHRVVVAPRDAVAILPARGPRAGVPPAGLALPRAAGRRAHGGSGPTRPGGGRVAVAIEPFARVSAAVRAGAEAERLAAFLGGDQEVTWAQPG